MQLTYLDRFKIDNKGLDEPSGLCLSADHDHLWCVCDDSRKLYAISFEGKPLSQLDINTDGLEAIAVDSQGDLLVVREESNELLRVNVHSEEIGRHVQLEELDGFHTVEHLFDENTGDHHENKGIESIAWDPKREHFWLVKEWPRWLIGVSSDLTEVIGSMELTADLGYTHDSADDSELDISDMCVDPVSRGLWFLSDKGQCVYLADESTLEVVERFSLSYGKNGKRAEIDKPEGIAVCPDGEKLYVVSDSEARLYVFAIH